MDEDMWRSRARSRTKSTSCSLDSVLVVDILESGSQQLQVIKKNLTRNSLNLIEKSSFLLRVLKTYVLPKSLNFQ